MKQFKAYDDVRLSAAGLCARPSKLWIDRVGVVLYANRGTNVCVFWKGRAAEEYVHGDWLDKIGGSNDVPATG